MRRVNAGRKNAMQRSQHLYRSRPARVPSRRSQRRLRRALAVPAGSGAIPFAVAAPCRRRRPMRRISGAAKAAL